MRIEDASRDGEVIHVDGVFDGLTARRVEALLGRAAEGRSIDLDLTQVRDFHDFGVAVLAQALTRSRARVAVRGLRLHQLRLLRYFGVATGPLDRVSVSDAA